MELAPNWNDKGLNLITGLKVKPEGNTIEELEQIGVRKTAGLWWSDDYIEDEDYLTLKKFNNEDFN